jgi:hypothetical protein
MTSHIAKHRDNSDAAAAECTRRDNETALTWPCNHYQPKHSAFVAAQRQGQVAA